MTKISVNTDELTASSQKLQALKQRIAGLSSELMRISGSAPAYQGQFSPRVLGLGTQAHLRVINQSNKFGTQSSRLAKTAKRFADADSGFGNSTRWDNYFKKIADKIRGFFSGFSPSLLGQLGVMTSLGSLFAARAPWNPSPVYAPGPDSKQGIKYDNVNLNTPSKGNLIFTENIIEEDVEVEKNAVMDMALTVKNGEANIWELGYPRNGYDGVQSNCTWFTAQAVLLRSNGKIRVENWGAASEWRSMARKELGKGEDGFVTGIDKEPREGDILCFTTFHHVAYVEKVEIINGETMVTWIEENASGNQGWPDNKAEQIIKDGKPILRWRHTRPLKSIAHKAEFVHLNY